MHGVLGLHRHVVRLVELGPDGDRTSYVVKELPDHLAEREYRLLRALADDRLPTVLVVRRRHRARRRPRRAADHAPPRLLAAVPHAAVGARHDDPVPRRAAARLRSSGCSCDSTSPGSSGATARCRTRCSAATPGAAGVHHRRRDERAVPAAHRPGSARWTSTSPPRTSPAGCSTCRPAGGSSATSTRGRSPSTSRRGTASLWDELTGDRGVRHSRAVARRAAAAPAPRPRLRRRRDGGPHRRGW